MKIRTIRKRREPERAMQVSLFQWAKMQECVLPGLALLFAVPNGGKRDYVTAARMKAEGIKSGVPDVCLPVLRRNCFIAPVSDPACYSALWLELKAGKNPLRPEQKAWRDGLRSAGNAVVTVRDDWQAASRLLTAYLTDARSFARLYRAALEDEISTQRRKGAKEKTNL